MSASSKLILDYQKEGVDWRLADWQLTGWQVVGLAGWQNGSVAALGQQTGRLTGLEGSRLSGRLADWRSGCHAVGWQDSGLAG
jgi:hypothetical protein